MSPLGHIVERCAGSCAPIPRLSKSACVVARAPSRYGLCTVASSGVPGYAIAFPASGSHGGERPRLARRAGQCPARMVLRHCTAHRCCRRSLAVLRCSPRPSVPRGTGDRSVKPMAGCQEPGATPDGSSSPHRAYVNTPRIKRSPSTRAGRDTRFASAHSPPLAYREPRGGGDYQARPPVDGRGTRRNRIFVFLRGEKFSCGGLLAVLRTKSETFLAGGVSARKPRATLPHRA